MESRSGYTLPELMASITIIGILAVTSVPNISSFLRSQSSSNAIQQVGAHLRMARSRAILEGNDYLVEFTGANTYIIVDDDGGANGIPGAAGYVAANRNNWTADAGETVLGPFQLPRDLRFETVSGIKNPWTGQALDAAITFPEIDSNPTAVFHPNGTADSAGLVAIQPQADVEHDHTDRCRVLQVVASTGAVEMRSAGR